MIACQLLHRCCELNDLVYLGQPIQLMDEAKSSRIYCKYILDVVQSWPFFCLCLSSIIMERLPKMRNNNLIWCWNSHRPKEYFWVNGQHYSLPFGCLLWFTSSWQRLSLASLPFFFFLIISCRSWNGKWEPSYPQPSHTPYMTPHWYLLFAH